jgi:hypothetical protein
MMPPRPVRPPTRPSLQKGSEQRLHGGHPLDGEAATSPFLILLGEFRRDFKVKRCLGSTQAAFGFLIGLSALLYRAVWEVLSL